MPTYVPPVITNGSPFSSAQVTTGLTDLAAVLNGNVDAANLNKSRLHYRSFHPGATTQTWATSGTQALAGIASLPVIFDPAATIPSTYGSQQNVYDVPNTGVDFYLHDVGDLWIDGAVSLYRPKDLWNVALGSTLTYVWDVQLVLDGAVVRTAQYSIEGANSGHSLAR